MARFVLIVKSKSSGDWICSDYQGLNMESLRINHSNQDWWKAYAGHFYLTEERAKELGWSEEMSVRDKFVWATKVANGEVAAPAIPGPRKPIPQCPPEVWQTKAPDPERCWEAILAMCGATKA